MEPINQGAFQAEQSEADARRRSKSSLSILKVLAEAVLIVVVTGNAWWYLRWPATEAANMPQDSAKYAVAAWNLYATGRYELTINNRGYPTWGGFGYGLLIVPSYWIFGSYIGNAIYTQTALAVLICLIVYFCLRRWFGWLPALLAALVLPLYPDFMENARLNDTDMPAAFFLALGLLIFIWTLQDTRYRSLKWLLWGLCIGWGTAVRTSNLPVFLALTVALACLSHRRPSETLGNVVLAIVGSLPLMIPLLWYNHHYCGSCFRDPHAFWESKEFDHVSQFFGVRYVFGSPDSGTENLSHSGNLIFYGREILAQFSRWSYFVTNRDFLARELTGFLSGLMVVGVLCAWRRARSSPAAFHLLCYAVVGSGTTLLFYGLKSGGNIRYLVPIIPFAAIFTATAVVDGTRKLGRQRLLRLLVPVFWLAVAVTPYRWARNQGVRNRGELIPIIPVLDYVNQWSESNAVVIGFQHWELVNHILIRGTLRQFVPIRNKSYFRVQPQPPAEPRRTGPAGTMRTGERQTETGAADLFDFSATEDPRRIQQFLARGLPVYVIDFPAETAGHRLAHANEDALVALSKEFDLVPWGNFTVLSSPLEEIEGVTFTAVWKVQTRIPSLL